jgi:hypothetical protein
MAGIARQRRSGLAAGSASEQEGGRAGGQRRERCTSLVPDLTVRATSPAMPCHSTLAAA